MKLLSRWFGRSPAPPAWIEAAALAARRERDAAVLILDVRGADEFTGPLGHIAGATNLPLDKLPEHIADVVRHDLPVVVVCKTDRRSSIAANQLMKAGVADVIRAQRRDGTMARARLAGFRSRLSGTLENTKGDVTDLLLSRAWKSGIPDNERHSSVRGHYRYGHLGSATDTVTRPAPPVSRARCVRGWPASRYGGCRAGRARRSEHCRPPATRRHCRLRRHP